MNESKIAKPLILEMEEAEKETVGAVNDIIRRHNLPCYFYEMIFEKIHRQLLDGKKNEVASASGQYEEEIKAASKEPTVAKNKEG